MRTININVNVVRGRSYEKFSTREFESFITRKFPDLCVPYSLVYVTMVTTSNVTKTIQGSSTNKATLAHNNLISVQCSYGGA